MNLFRDAPNIMDTQARETSSIPVNQGEVMLPPFCQIRCLGSTINESLGRRDAVRHERYQTLPDLDSQKRPAGNVDHNADPAACFAGVTLRMHQTNAIRHL